MEHYREIRSADNFNVQQDLTELIEMIERAAKFAGESQEQIFEAALFRLGAKRETLQKH